MELNDAQKKAVSHFEGPMMVLAGPFFNRGKGSQSLKYLSDYIYKGSGRGDAGTLPADGTGI